MNILIYQHQKKKKMLHFPSMSFHILESLQDSSLSIVIIYCQCEYIWPFYFVKFA